MRLIDADAMLETLKRKYPQWYTEKPKDSWMHYAWSVYYWAVENAPTIDAVPATIEGALGYLHKVGWMQEHDRIMTEDVAPVRHAHWIEATTDIICSGCETAFSDEIGYAIRDCLYSIPRYCPWCGARMDGESDE